MKIKTDIYNSLIIDTIKAMIELANNVYGDAVAYQELNGVTVHVKKDTNADLAFRDQQRAQRGYIPKKVGPHFSAELTEIEKATDASVEAENERTHQEYMERQREQDRIKRESMDARLTNAPDIELSEPDKWQEFKNANTDPYGGAVVTYSERWARLMQVELAQGKTLADVAYKCSRDADLEGITGFMYGCAVSTLAQCWIHGEELRRWHNKDTQIGTEGDAANESGGVLNPAMLGFAPTG